MRIKKSFLLFLPFLIGVFFLGWTLNDLTQRETPEESELRVLREKEIQKLEGIVHTKKNSTLPLSQKLEIFLRLQEAYSESYRSFFILEGRFLAEHSESKIMDRTLSRSFLLKAIQVGELFLSQNPVHSSDFDQVFYAIGFHAREVKDFKKSQRYYSQLIQGFPKSQWLGKSYRALGEMADEMKSFSQAQSYYQKALPNVDVQEVPFLLKKMAWTYFRMRDPNQGILYLKKAIEKAREKSVREDLIQDLVSMGVDSSEKPEALVHYFLGLSSTVALNQNESIRRVLESLGMGYERSLKLQEARLVYEILFQKAPHSEEAFRAHVRILDRLFQEQMERQKRAQKEEEAELLTWKNFFEVLSRVHFPSSSGLSFETQESFKKLLFQLKKIATTYHELFRKEKRPSLLKVAEKAYEWEWVVLDKRNALESQKEIQEIQVYLAEVKKDLKKWAEFNRLARNGVVGYWKTNPSVEREAVLLMWMAGLNEQLQLQLTPIQRQEVQVDLLQAVDFLTKRNPNHSELKEINLRIAQWLADDPKTQPDSILRIKNILDQWPSSEQAWIAAQLWIQLTPEKDQKDFIQNFQSRPLLLKWDQEKHQGKISSWMKQKALLFQVQAISEQEKTGDWKKAALGYEAFAKEVQTGSKKKSAYKNAASLYAQQGAKEDFFRVLKDWKALQSGALWDDDALQTVKELGTLIFFRLASQEEWDQAVFFLEQLGSAFLVSSFFEKAAQIQEAREKLQAAIGLLEKAKNLPTVFFKLGKLYEQSGQLSLALKAYEKCAPVRVDCLKQEADLKEMNQKDVRFLPEMEKLAHSSFEDGNPWVGYARYRLFQRKKDQSPFLPLELPQAVLQSRLAERFKKQKDLTNWAQSVVEAGGPWSLFALRDLVKWIQAFAAEVDATPPDPHFQAKALENFRKSLASVSSLLRSQANEMAKEAYSQALADSILSPATLDLWTVAQASTSRSASFEGKWSDRTNLKPDEITLKGDPLNALGWWNRGLQYWTEDKKGLALWALEQARVLSPTDSRILNDLAVMSLLKQGVENFVAATESLFVFDKILKKDPSFVPAKMNRESLLNFYGLNRK